MAFIQSYGAAKVVTGSAHLLTLDSGTKILIDCGMFQGEHEKNNSEKFEFDPKEVDYLIFTHAHLDHVGRAPMLFKHGFRGKIITTKATLDLARIIMLDSAHLMEESFRLHFKKAQRRSEEHQVQQPLYTPQNVESLLTLKKKFAQYDKTINLEEGVALTFRNAGHILGSAFVEVMFKEKGVKKQVVFSGDLGNINDFVLPSPEHTKEADALYIESTYGDRDHKGIEESIAEFKKIILDTLANDANVMIPSFAIERTQELLCLFKEMHLKGELPKCKIFLDSPMAIRATRVYNKHVDKLSQKCQDFEALDGTVFDFEALEFTTTPQASKKINEVATKAIIIAGSGMCNGGRIMHHFKHRLWNKRNAVIFVGYQAKGTLGRKIVEGAEWIDLYHEKIKVNASIHTINGFSAHADQSELLAWMRTITRLDKVYLIHGEEEKQLVFKDAIEQQLHKQVHIIDEEDMIDV